ncbi:MAG: hypothetical protein PHY09_03570 [Desulfuromonadaceae bacterium]|nr:hypothetical protein [Desulfuromonadaceae bacterium]MDD5104171.1 hypothetical protein [Desulfuromonadaceae bacterium]
MKVDMNSPIAANISINSIDAGNPLMNKMKSTLQKEKSSTGNGNQIPTANVDPVTVNLSLPKQTVAALERLGNLNDFLKHVATNLTKTDDGLKTANISVEQMKEQLEKIVKNFPPFGIESQERKEILMSYSAIQKEIIKMTIPSPPQPLLDKVEHLWNDLFSGVGGQSLSTPMVPLDAPDSHVNSALQRLDGTQAQIEAVRSELGNSLLLKKESN